MSGPFAGAVMTTFLAPAAGCLAASSRFVNNPVDSNTTSTPRSFHGIGPGSRNDSTLNSSPSTAMLSLLASTREWRLPSTESYFSKCASVSALVRSLTATKSMFLSPSAARMMLRPIRPKPLIPTFTGMSVLQRRTPSNPFSRRAPASNSSEAARDDETSYTGMVRRTLHSASRPLSRPRYTGTRRALEMRRRGTRTACCAGCTGSNGPAILQSSQHIVGKDLKAVPDVAMYVLYSFLTLAGFLVVSPYFLYQAVRYKKYIGSLRQRLGFLPISFNIDGEESIWIHAVSVGETLTARALAGELKARYPRLRLFLSTTTIAGQQVARHSLQNVDGVFYVPFDWTFIVRRTLTLVKPRLFVMMETEIWPNLLRECRKRGVKTVLINGRISSRSYPRYRLIRPFFRGVLANVDRFCMQSEESVRRLIDLGADASRITMTGSLKFDSLELPSATSHGKPRERVLRFFRISPNRQVVVAGSTLRGEEGPVLRAFNRVKKASPSALDRKSVG